MFETKGRTLLVQARPTLINRLAQRELFWAAVFIAPLICGLFIFTYIPVVCSLALSFSSWNLLGDPQWVGLENYTHLLGDPLFFKTMAVTTVFVVVGVTLEIVLALAVALLLNRAVQGIAVFRSVFFLPVVSPMVSVALVWGWIFDPQFGWLNALLQLIPFAHLPRIAWLYDEQWALWALIMIRIWKDLGYTMLILLAGLQGIQSHLYESARIDGAGWWRQLWAVTLPMLSPTLFFVITVAMIQAFQTFDVVYLLTEGGPGNSTQLLVYWLFKNAFQFYKVGPASAMAYVLFLIILSLTLVQWTLRKRWVLHE